MQTFKYLTVGLDKPRQFRPKIERRLVQVFTSSIKVRNEILRVRDHF